MAYKGNSSLDINLFHIHKTLKKLENSEITVKECGLNKRFERLKSQSIPWYEDLYPKYIQTVKKLNNY